MSVAPGPDAGHPPRRASPWLLALPGLAAAVALLVWWSTPRLGHLHPYALELVGPGASSPSAAGASGVASRSVELAAGGNLSLLLRPSAVQAEPVEVNAFVERSLAPAGQESVPVAVSVRDEVAGALRVSVSGANLPERGRLIVLVGREGLLPRHPVGTADHGRDWQRFDVGFVQR